MTLPDVTWKDLLAWMSLLLGGAAGGMTLRKFASKDKAARAEDEAGITLMERLQKAYECCQDDNKELRRQRVGDAEAIARLQIQIHNLARDLRWIERVLLDVRPDLLLPSNFGDLDPLERRHEPRK